MQEHGRYGMVQHSAAGVRRLAEDNPQAVHRGAAAVHKVLVVHK